MSFFAYAISRFSLDVAHIDSFTRALDKLLFQMSAVLVHLKKKGVTRNFRVLTECH